MGDPPLSKCPQKTFHAAAALFAALDRYIGSVRPQPTESACLRLALEEFLARRGFWPETAACPAIATATDSASTATLPTI
jgi:hypothetical protein